MVGDNDTVYACIAIAKASNWSKEAADAFAALFAPEILPDDHIERGWWGFPNEETRNCRVLALLLMAAIADEGDA